jgi:hypothetical protein
MEARSSKTLSAAADTRETLTIKMGGFCSFSPTFFILLFYFVYFVKNNPQKSWECGIA